MNVNKVVLAYSGGLDTSVILRWLKEQYGCEVIAFCADLGQGEDLQAVKRKAIQTGASKVVIGDLREEFVKDYVFPMLRANAVYEGSYLLGTSIARPLIAKGQIDVAVKEKADAVVPRRHRQGQRSGALRADLLCAQAGYQSHRAVAACGISTRARL